ncbi:hypothetical protein OVS_03245 [Mycoplasma ovis str. Michigan]|uniref:Uncharacterized protein n=1 Tax=Mycoplasma ovis str. Michigan TaxID=1415773 RepID=A0ABN4BND9_9MOLU|nr:hypothetical protein [Mycoplasma ovis]AHC40402.1 hypothetical protein OVS_03245 [Mycoplasma ovis str. Michigan]
MIGGTSFLISNQTQSIKNIQVVTEIGTTEPKAIEKENCSILKDIEDIANILWDFQELENKDIQHCFPEY